MYADTTKYCTGEYTKKDIVTVVRTAMAKVTSY